MTDEEKAAKISTAILAREFIDELRVGPNEAFLMDKSFLAGIQYEREKVAKNRRSLSFTYKVNDKDVRTSDNPDNATSAPSPSTSEPSE